MSSENTIWEQLRSKDRAVFEKVFREYYRALCLFAVQYVGSMEAAEEVVQEMFVRFWERPDQLEIKTSLKSYLYGAVRNSCLNVIKHEQVKRAHVSHEKALGSDLSDHNPVEYSELQDSVKSAISSLPDKCRAVFKLSREEGKKYQEIADELGISVKTVENQMGKALRFLRDKLSHYLPVIFWLLTASMIFLQLNRGKEELNCLIIGMVCN